MVAVSRNIGVGEGDRDASRAWASQHGWADWDQIVMMFSLILGK